MMRLELLIKKLRVPPLEVRGALETGVAGVECDSRRIAPGSLFAAVRGEAADGHAFIGQAIERGARVIVCEALPEQMPEGVTFVLVEDARMVLAEMAAAMEQFPAGRLRMIGVTGTNGKTTSTYLIKAICDAALLRCGLIGTVHYDLGEDQVPAARTTPDAVELQRLLGRMVNNGCKAAVMEASSHAIVQRRVHGVEFDVVAFTNLTQDHLDYHGTMERYFEAKALLFEQAAGQQRKAAVAVINADDRHGEKLVNRLQNRMEVLTFGMGVRAMFRAGNLRTEFSGTSFSLDAGGRQYLVRTPLVGRFNVYNALGALAVAQALGLPLRDAVRALATAPPVPGRMQPVPVKRAFSVFVDYAHTPDALEKAIETVRALDPRRVIVVFGCGGDRDRAKRPLLGAVVERLADWAVVTSDNPRTEDPEAIIREIEKGMVRNRYEVVPDRAAAIERAVRMALPRDIVLIAGKGHENYQEVHGERHSFDDLQVATRAIEDRAAEGGAGAR